MVKIKKTCDNCVWFARKECKTPGKICHKWIFLKANCTLCTYRKECKKLGKKVGKNNICLTFKKEKRKGKRKKPKISRKEILRINKKLEKDSKEVEDTFSPADIVENIISTDYAPEVFDLVDDRDIPKAHNPIQCIIGKEFMGVKLFPMQLKTFLEFLGAYCPDCSDTNFIRNKIEVDTPVDEILDRTVLYRDGVCRKCGLTKYEAVKTGKQRFFNQLIGVAGQRSSKSTSVAILSAAITHEYLKLPSPVEFFHLLSTSTLHGTFVGLRYSDAYDNLWEPYSKLLTKTKWFKEYHAFLEETGNRLGVELFKFRDTFVTYSHKNIGVYPAGPDKRKLRGRTRFIAAIDELGWFIGGGRETIKFNPDEIYTALDNSLVPILPASKKLFKQHPDVPTAYGMYISSPSSKTDKAMRLYKQSKGSKTIYGFHKPTWEFNPDITKDSLAEKFRENPTTAERDWGANPPFSSDPFIKGPSNIVPIFTKRRNLFKVDGYVTTSDSLGGNLIYPKISFVRKHTFPSVLAIDCGYSINSFACTLNHWFVKNNELYYAISGAIEIIPDPYPISFPDVYDYVITPIVKEFNVKAVVFDRWQSIDLSQRTYKDHKIDSFLYSVTMDDFGNYRNKIYSGDCIFPRLECKLDDLLSLKKELGSLIAGNPISHLFLQLLMCKDTGRTVTKGDDITDDLLRSAVLGYSILTHKEYSKLFTTEGRVLNKYNRIESVLSLNLRSQPAPTEIESIGWGVKNVPGIGVSASRNFLRPQMRPLVTPAGQHFGRR